MPITYNTEKNVFIAVGKGLNDHIHDLVRHLRSCRETSRWKFDSASQCFSTTDISEITYGEFAEECDAEATAEIKRRKQKAQQPITSITFRNGSFVALDGGKNARASLHHLGWAYTKESLVCDVPFIVDVCNKYDCLDDIARAEFDRWKSDAERRIAASRAADTTASFSAPDGMEYLPFQRAGIEFCLQPGHKLLGDEMGLGKTIQAIGVANALKAQRVLVVCPASLKINWQREIEAWQTEALPVTILDKASGNVPTGFVIVNYDILHQVHKSLNTTWDLLIFDEAHYLKNEDTRRTQVAFGEAIEQVRQRVSKELARAIEKALKLGDFATMANLLNTDEASVRSRVDGSRVKVSGKWLVEVFGKEIVQQLVESERAIGLSAEKILFLTGTPIPNRPAELRPLLRWLDPNGLGAAAKKKWFLDRYCDPTFNEYVHTWEYKGASNTEELGRYLRQTAMVRRLKKDVLVSLPEKTRQVVEIECGAKIMKLVRQEAACAARRDAINEILKTTDNPSFHEQIKSLRVELGQIEENLAKLRKAIGLEKVPQVIEYVELCLSGGAEKVVVMAHHVVINQLMEQLKKFLPVKLDGEMSLPARQESIDRFQNEPACRVFVGSIQAAGVGITLTAASTVIFAEMDWVSGTMSQAESRCHRIGQYDNVLAQYLVYSGSLDAIMCKTLRRKEVAIQSALGDSVSHVSSVMHHNPSPVPQTLKRGRGRPKVYRDSQSPAQTATERSKRSIKLLAAAGGKRVMLRLSPEAHEALKVIMALTGGNQETATINQTLIARKQELLNASTIIKSTTKSG